MQFIVCFFACLVFFWIYGSAAAISGVFRHVSAPFGFWLIAGASLLGLCILDAILWSIASGLH